MIIEARAVEGTLVGLGQAGLKSNQSELPLMLLVLPLLLLTGLSLEVGLANAWPRITPITPIVFQSSFPRSAWPSSPNPLLLLSLRLLSLMRAIAPQPPFPPNLLPIRPFLLYCSSPQISFDCLNQDLSQRIVRG